jgi:uncharacterized protein YfdQ (DUF2303 family)
MDRTNADAVAELARNGAVRPEIITTSSGRELLILPDANGAASYQDVSEPGDQLAPAPAWIEQGVTVQTADSLAAYAERFGHDKIGSSLFADIERNRIVAALDYHTADDGGVTHAARVAHRATLDLPFSVEWALWSSIDGQLLGQLEFARFLEENAADIEAPAAADLLETCRDLQANRKVNFTKAVRTNSDNENFEYVDETNASSRKNGSVEIPTRFELRIPVYFGGPTYSLGAFLRWRLVEGEGLKLGIRLHNPEHVRQAVFKEVVAGVADATGFPAYYGRI